MCLERDENNTFQGGKNSPNLPLNFELMSEMFTCKDKSTTVKATSCTTSTRPDTNIIKYIFHARPSSKPGELLHHRRLSALLAGNATKNDYNNVLLADMVDHLHLDSTSFRNSKSIKTSVCPLRGGKQSAEL